MYWLLNILGLVKVAMQRQRSYFGLVLALLAGFIVAVALVVSIPLYADAVAYRILRSELRMDEDGTTRPPFSYMFVRRATSIAPIPVDAYQQADAYFSSAAVRDLGLPPDVTVRYAVSNKLQLLPPDNDGAAAAEQLMWVNLAFASDIEQNVEITEGTFPRPADDDGGPVEVMISQGLAETLGVQIGEEYLTLEESESGNQLRLPVRIAGVWRARDPNHAYWFIHPDSLQDVFMLPEQTYKTRVLTQGSAGLYQTLWYLVLDGSEVRSRHVPALLGRMGATLLHAAELLPDTQLSISPQYALERQYTQARLLTVSLITFSIPILGLIAYFIIMVSGMVVQRQQNEIAVLRGRGVSRSEVLGLYLLEGVGLGVVALVVGIFVGRYGAMLMGWTRSFLAFEPRSDVPVELSPESIRSGLWVVGLTLVTSLLPALGAAGHTIISYKQERARSIRRPLWQRLYLDVLLLIPAVYGYQQLRQRGTISILGTDLPGGDPFSNPLLILTPALWLLVLALLSARIFPLIMGFFGHLVSRLRGVSSLLALQYLTRSPRGYTGPVLLLILTLSLAIFTASMARTLDGHLYDQILYDVGSDMRVSDLGESLAPAAAQDGGTPTSGQGSASPAQEPSDEPKWLFLPVTDYLRIPGVLGATRVSRSNTVAAVVNNRESGTLLGLDRVDFPGVAHWRSDYASESLGGLMNALGANPNGLLVSRRYLQEQGLGIGSKVNLELHDVGETRPVPFVVVGALDYFPTLYPEDGPFFVANLDYIFEQQGGEFPYEVWLNVTPGTTKGQVDVSMHQLGLRSLVSREAPRLILAAQEKPERQGLYGLLSLGFFASALLTGLGFLFYSIVSFQRRFIELGMLRAIGLSVRQMAALLLWEQSLIIGTGMVAGTAFGIGVSQMFIPFLQVRAGEHSQTPPFLVLIAWQQAQLIYLIFAILLGLALAIVAWLLLRMKIFQAVKLGEAA